MSLLDLLLRDRFLQLLEPYLRFQLRYPAVDLGLELSPGIPVLQRRDLCSQGGDFLLMAGNGALDVFLFLAHHFQCTDRAGT